MTHRPQPADDKDEISATPGQVRPHPSARVAAWVLGFVCLVLGVHLAAHFVTEHSVGHVVHEIVVMVVSLAGLGYLWRQWAEERRTSQRLVAQLASARDESRRWRRQAEAWRAEAREALDGLGVAIDRQFARWELTEAEREVAALLLKGLSHKEVAEVRGTSERTARQQALGIYRKADVAGRAELSAFFLEDLLPPAGDRDRAANAPG